MSLGFAPAVEFDTISEGSCPELLNDAGGVQTEEAKDDAQVKGPQFGYCCEHSRRRHLAHLVEESPGKFRCKSSVACKSPTRPQIDTRKERRRSPGIQSLASSMSSPTTAQPTVVVHSVTGGAQLTRPATAVATAVPSTATPTQSTVTMAHQPLVQGHSPAPYCVQPPTQAGTVLVMPQIPQMSLPPMQMPMTVVQVQGQAPTPLSAVPTMAQVPTVGQVSTLGQVAAVGQVPVPGQVPTIGHMPSMGQIPIGQGPAALSIPGALQAGYQGVLHQFS